ncbi:esterase/lipase family protein [Collimonas antrihumi]|uniref:esterase/lipase family protein n=1 Tax=Collimonas antrihumi TaxID=1940615 RepID=UPI001B8AD5D4|nr:hypothetical protein [Collimonas antrihumi]
MATINRIIPPVIAEDGSVHYTSIGSPPDDSTAMCYMVPDRVIPVIFVPGVMGTNLKGSDNRPVWLVNSPVGAAKDWIVAGPGKRKQKLDPQNTAVYAGGKIPIGTVQTEAELRRRGWGEVSYMSYGTWLVWLENALNDVFTPGTDYGRRGLRASLMKQLVADAPGVDLLTKEEWSLSCKYQFPVHAVGYNWLQSNADSAQTLSDRIDKITAYYRDKFGYRCDKVIIVTHSMGGLVARHYSEVLDGGKRDKVLGIVHGVMPTTGAGTAYKRVKAGTEGGAGIVIGPNAGTVTPVFSQSPGPLQLLPSAEYGKNWLKIVDGDRVVELPTTDDPYRQIYKQRGQWWGLVDEKLINPLDKGKKILDQDWAAYVSIIDEDVKKFHMKIANQYHQHTYAFYGNDAKHKAWGDVVWERKLSSATRWLGTAAAIDHMQQGQVLSDNGTGEQRLLQRSGGTPMATGFSVRDAGEDGDGTVPIRSGRASQQRMKACVPYPGVEHEGAYKLLPQRLFALWAITKIAQNVKGTTLEYKDC